MKLRAFVSLTCSLLFAGLRLFAADEKTLAIADAPRDIGEILKSVVARHRVPGLSAVVLRGDRVVGAGVAGVRKAGAAEPIAIDDRLLLCSGTKPMTATVAALVVEDGKLSWDSTLGEVLSDSFPQMDPAWRPVTLAQLIEHRAGVPNDGVYLWKLVRVQLFSSATPSARRQAIITKVLKHAPQSPPGSRFVYSSLDYFMVAAMLEKVTGRTFEELIRERLWLPLGIASGGFGSPGTAGKIDAPWGHWAGVFTGRPIRPTGFWGRLMAPPYYAPAGTASMTIADWGKFIALHLRGDPANPRPEVALLSAESFATLHRGPRLASPEPADVSPQPNRWPSQPPLRRTGFGYEGGWFLEKHEWASGHRAGDTGRVLRSLGDNGFWHIDAQVAPEIDFAVLVVCNQGGVDKKPAAMACEDAIATLRREFLKKP
jgi:CubicO group peptidase (beta-lactamase class C family)